VQREILFVKKRKDHFFAVTAPGLEEVCAAELHRLGVPDVNVGFGGVTFSGGYSELYRANLWLRTASKVLVRVGEFRARDFPDLYRKALSLPWGRFLRVGSSFRVRGSAHRSRLMHTGRISTTVAEAIERSLGGHSEASSNEEVEAAILVRVEEDLCTLSIDSSGALLHRRGYRGTSVPAPLRETLAAGVLLLSGWDGRTPLLDPMCGSGTIPLEGGLLALGRAPGLNRRFAFMGWPRYRPGLWDALILDARRGERTDIPSLFGYDREEVAVHAASANALRAGLDSDVRFDRNDFFCVGPPCRKGFLLCNPPYGARLKEGADMIPFFREFGKRCRTVFSMWDVAFLCPEERLAAATGLDLNVTASLVNGGIPVKLYQKASGEGKS